MAAVRGQLASKIVRRVETEAPLIFNTQRPAQPMRKRPDTRQRQQVGKGLVASRAKKLTKDRSWRDADRPLPRKLIVPVD